MNHALARLLTATATMLLALGGAAAVSADTILVPAGSAWRYRDDGSNQGTAWRAAAFNDSAWPLGAAQLGYGDGDEATVVGFGPDPNSKYVTTYFRHAFTVTDPAAFAGLTLELTRDDGAVVFLNGVEVFRSNMPAGAIAHTTLASSAIGGTAESTFYSTTVNPALLVAGGNVLAAEVHQANGTSSDVSFDLRLSASGSAAVTRGPYLQQGTATSVVIRWRTSAPTDSRVEYGLDPANLTASEFDPAVTAGHEVTLSGLAPDTRYYYAVGTGAERLAGGDASHYFLTAPATSRPSRIWVLGDSGTANLNAAAVRDAYLAHTGSRHTDMWLMLGDNAYPDGTDSEYQAAVFNMYPQTLRQSVLWPTLGNHDGHTADSATGTGPYYDIFTLPTKAEAGGLASGTEAYYSFDYGNVHFICLESFETDRSATGAMMTWLESDLASTVQDWIVAFWHHPPYSKGSHNSDSEAELIQMRQNALPILEAGGVDLVLTGHSHSYERSFLLDGHYGASSTLTPAMKKDGGDGRETGTGAYQKPAGGPAARQGAVYAVAGSSGQTSGGVLNHPAMFISLNSLGSLVLDIAGTRLDAKFLDQAGAVRDSFTILKGAPAAPSGLIAAAVSTSQINLQWSDNASNEDGFKVERCAGASCTNFTQVAQLAANATAHSDTGLAAATPYRYRVRSFNGVGHSAYSNIAAATTQGGGASPPAAPSNITGTSSFTGSGKNKIFTVALTWQDNSNNETAFVLERCKESGKGSSKTCAYSTLATLGANVTGYTDGGLSRGTYRYRVKARNASGDSGCSDVAAFNLR